MYALVRRRRVISLRKRSLISVVTIRVVVLIALGTISYLKRRSSLRLKTSNNVLVNAISFIKIER